MKKQRVLFFLLLVCSVLNSLVTAQSAGPAEVCNQALKQGDYQAALDVCERALQKSLQNKVSSDTLSLYFHLADIQHALGNSPRQSHYLDQAQQHPLFSVQVESQYQWHRKKGQQFYFAKDFQLAKNHLSEALNVAVLKNDPAWLSKSYNDVGLVESKLGQFKSSLQNYQQSLKLKLENGDLYPIGTTLNNLGLVHIEIEDYPSAVTYYEKALDSFLRYTQQENFDQRVLANIAHLYEDLAIAYAHVGNVDQENFYLEKTLATIELKQSARQQARALVNVAKLQIQDAKYGSAQEFLDKAVLLQQTHQFNLKSEINFQLARLAELAGNTDKAISHANIGLINAQESADLQSTADFYQLLSRLFRHSDATTAYYYLELYSQSRESYLAQKFDHELKNVQIQIEKQQVEADLVVEQLNNERNKSKIQVLTNWSLIVAILFLLSVGLFVLHMFKKKKEKEALLQTIQFHRQQVLALDDKYRNLNQTHATEASADRAKTYFRQSLVNAMLDALAIWEKHTQSNRVELAEQSKIWTVSIDEGTLRTRSLDKYLSIDKMPLNPRWRNVARTCHFILSQHDLNEKDRSLINRRLEGVLEAVRAMSLDPSEMETTD